MISKSIITVRYAETDQMGIVHHSVYPIWYEVARSDFMKEMGMSYSNIEKLGIMTPVVEVKCKYIKPAYYEDRLVIETKIKSLNFAKIEFEYLIYNDYFDKPINIGSTVHAWTDTSLKLINLKKVNKDIYDLIHKAL